LLEEHQARTILAKKIREEEQEWERLLEEKGSRSARLEFLLDVLRGVRDPRAHSTEKSLLTWCLDSLKDLTPDTSELKQAGNAAAARMRSLSERNSLDSAPGFTVYRFLGELPVDAFPAEEYEILIREARNRPDAYLLPAAVPEEIVGCRLSLQTVLLELLAHEDWRMRRSAGLSLSLPAAMACARVREVLIGTFDNHEPMVRQRILQTLAAEKQIGEVEALLVRRAAESDSNDHIRAEASLVMVRPAFDGAETLTVARRNSTSRDADLRRASALLLRRSKAPEDVAVLRALADSDPDAKVREAAKP
jgi:hypothetical protein